MMSFGLASHRVVRLTNNIGYSIEIKILASYISKSHTFHYHFQGISLWFNTNKLS